MIKHTPGPWKVTDSFEISVDDGDVQPLVATVNADSTSVSAEQAKADARLIAAAPAMWAVLTEISSLAGQLDDGKHPVLIPFDTIIAVRDVLSQVEFIYI